MSSSCISRPLWMEYLRWYRNVLKLPVENGIEVTCVRPLDNLLELEIVGGEQPSILTRRVVLANGREGLGAPTIPSFVRDLPRKRWSHSSDDFDFATLHGKRVVVIGVGASAMDNAAVALEEGAREVRLLARRRRMPTINKLMGVGSYGMTAGFPRLSPAWRWRIMDYSFKQQTPAPRNSTQRVSRHPNAFFHFGCGIESMRVQDDEVVIRTQAGRNFVTDHVILEPGSQSTRQAGPNFAEYSDRIATWGDSYAPPPDARNAELATFHGSMRISFHGKVPGTAPWLSKIHCFNYGATMSLGRSAETSRQSARERRGLPAV